MWGLSSSVTRILRDVHSSTTGWRLSETEPRSRERRTLTSGPASTQTLPGERGEVQRKVLWALVSYLVWILHDAIIVITPHYTGHNTKIQTNFGIIIRSSGPRCPALKPKLEIQSPCMARQTVESLITLMMSSDERVTWWSLQASSPPSQYSTSAHLVSSPLMMGAGEQGGGQVEGRGRKGRGGKHCLIMSDKRPGAILAVT